MIDPIHELLAACGCHLIAGRYELIAKVNGGYGAASYQGKDRITGAHVFMKYLIAPRGPDELARFAMEASALEELSQQTVRTAPRLFHHGLVANGAIYAVVTEWIEGTPLSHHLQTAPSALSTADKLRLLQRVTLAVQFSLSRVRHRDLHPGNILILPEQLVRIGPDVPEHRVETGVRIVDWGESTPIVYGNYDDEPDHHFIVLEREGKRIGGSFTSLPPEVFSPPSVYHAIGGRYESWALGLISVRLLLDRAPPENASLGDYLRHLNNGEIETWTRQAEQDLRLLHLPGGEIIPSLIKGLLQIDVSKRLEPSDAKQVLWDVLIEEFCLEDSAEVVTYLRDPFDYRPADGWRFSGTSRDD